MTARPQVLQARFAVYPEDVDIGTGVQPQAAKEQSHLCADMLNQQGFGRFKLQCGTSMYRKHMAVDSREHREEQDEGVVARSCHCPTCTAVFARRQALSLARTFDRVDNSHLLRRVLRAHESSQSKQ